jgi:hypothetical protein
MKSEKIELLVKALIKAKASISPVAKTKENPFFKSKYADLGTIDEAVKGPLKDNGLVVVQTTEVISGQAVLVTTLLHDSGQWIEGQYPLNPVKNDPQGLGSATTYARRYALSALLGVICDEDDDGNHASSRNGHSEPQERPQERSQATSSPVGGTISEAQGKRLYAIWKSAKLDDSEVKEHIQKKYGFNSTRDITRDCYDEIIEWIQETGVKVS